MAYKVVNGKVINAKKNVELTFIAIRHTEDGCEEFCSARAEASIDKKLDKNDLLAYICLKDWCHNPPVSAIAAYLIKTKTYEMFNSFNNKREVGYVINFYESDKTLSQENGRYPYSCRDIYVVPIEAIKDLSEKMYNQYQQDPNMSMRRYEEAGE